MPLPFCVRTHSASRLSVCTVLLAGLWGALVTGRAGAAESVQTGASHRGVVPSGPYQIFPENRFSNAVYLDGILLFSLPGQTILSAAQIAPGGRLIYLARGPDGKRAIGVHTKDNEAPPRLSEPAKGYQYVIAGFDGQGFKKLFRVTDTAITDLMPASRTADGLTPGAKGILFFHVASSPGSPAPTVGELPPPNTFGIRLHWLNLATGAVKHLGRPIYNQLPGLKLSWIDDDKFEYTLNDGHSETLTVADFK